MKGFESREPRFYQITVKTKDIGYLVTGFVKEKNLQEFALRERGDVLAFINLRLEEPGEEM